MKRLTSLTLVIVLVAGFLGGCKKTDNTPAPTLPPATSMSIDFSNFAAKKSTSAENNIQGLTTVDKSNYVFASSIAGIWSTILAINLAVPVASFGLAVNNIPTYLGSNTWEWKYDFEVVGATFKARLTGELKTSDVQWKMYISKEGVGAFSELLWYSGTSQLDGKSGQWVLNHSKEFPEPALQIDWQIDGTSIGSVKYTYIRDLKDDRTTEPFKLSYIEYGVTSNTLNAFYNIHMNNGTQGVFNDVFIEWSTTAHNGHVKANNQFGDDLWHCWNETGENVVCN